MIEEPRAARVPHTWQRPNGEVVDDFAWLVDKSDPEMVAYLESENAYADSWFAERQHLVDTVFGEIKLRTQETDTSPPTQSGDWWYSSSTEQAKSYPVFRRGPTAESATRELVLDLNHEAEGHDYFDLGVLDVSPNHQLMAWSGDVRGDERYTMRIRDLTTGVDLPDRLHDTSYAGTAWSADCRHLFYVVVDDHERPSRVLRHQVGTDQADDVEVFREDDERFFVGLGLTRNDQTIVIQSGSKTSSESWLIPSASPTDSPRLVRRRRPNVEYHVDDWGDCLVIVTNENAVDFRIATADHAQPEIWHDLVDHQPGRRIVSADPFAGFLAVQEWHQAQEQMRIVARDGSSQVLAIDTEPHGLGFGANEVWDTTTIRLSHQSLTTPHRWIDVDIATSSIRVVKQRPTPNVDLDQYASRRLWATAADGTRVPVDIVHHVGTTFDGTAPCTVYGYGAYESSTPPWFSVARLSLLDRGHVWALAHPRGGGELGRQWYLDGKLLNKINSFTDTLAVCEHLRALEIAGPLAIRGASAGGLLVGGCVTMAPQLFDAAIAEVPFVDVVTTMSDPSLPLTVTEWEEWGDPRENGFAEYIASYSPYDNTRPADYPALYVSAGLNDPRVSVHEPAKWVAKLRLCNQGDRPILLRTDLGAGHGGPTGRYEAWLDEARILAFTLATLGPDDARSPATESR